MPRKRRRIGTTTTTRQRPAACDSCGMKIRTTRAWIEQVGLPLCRCGGEFRLTAIEDRVNAGEIDPRTLDAKTLRTLGWDAAIHRRSPGRKSRQRQCDGHAGCSRFVSTSAERCAGGHVQQWAARLGATAAAAF